MNNKLSIEYNKQNINKNIWKISLKYANKVKYNNIYEVDSIYKSFINELNNKKIYNTKHKALSLWSTLINTNNNVKNSNKKIIHALNLFNYNNVINNI